MTEPDFRTLPGPAGSLAAGKRAGLAAGPRAVYQAVLRAFAATGRPPGPAELDETARRHGIIAGQALAALAAADVLGLDDHGRVRMAYPLSSGTEPVADGRGFRFVDPATGAELRLADVP